MPNGAPKKFLFVSDDGLIHDLAWVVRKEGNEVRYYIHAKSEKTVADGFVDKTENLEESILWADVIVFDDVGFGAQADKLRKAGKLVVGGSVYGDRLEHDRDFGQEEMKAVGMTTLTSLDFQTFDDAIAYVRANPNRYVVKPSGKAQNDKVLSFVGQEDQGEDIVTILEHYKKTWGGKIKSFQLQKYAAGVEVAVGAFFNGNDFILPVNVNFEHKRMFNDEVGPSTGEMGTSMFWSGENQLYRTTLGRMTAKLREAKYVGYIDVNCIVNGRGIYPLEFTSRFGYPTINIQIEGILSRWSDFLRALAAGENFALRAKKGFQVGVVIAVPPFPFTDRDTFEKYSGDAPIIFKKPMTEGLHPGDVKIVDNEWVLAGSSGYALVVTGSGSTMEASRKEAYNRVHNILIPNMFYRTDIGERWARESDLLHTWGYLT
ncbi:MAG TPA: phosphoribosylamine--glycine ligase [Bdellovibrionota bacterium]|nr:phosphoribosylamine--glycine ligase [Bdellovibrionota bacterium]